MALALGVGSRQNNPASGDMELTKKRKFFLGTVRPGLNRAGKVVQNLHIDVLMFD